MRLSDDFPMTLEREAGMHDTIPEVAVGFGMYPVIDKKKSDAAGHQVYKDVEFVKIAIPGDRNSLYFQPSTEQHRLRFPKSYAAFKQREHKPVEGMPIEEWAPISRSMAYTLKAMHIHTVEALAAVHDGNIDRIGGNGRELREKAKAWLAEAKEGAATQKLAAEKQALQDQISAMQAQILALSEQTSKKSRSDDDDDDDSDDDSTPARSAAAARKPLKRDRVRAQ